MVLRPKNEPQSLTPSIYQFPFKVFVSILRVVFELLHRMAFVTLGFILRMTRAITTFSDYSVNIFRLGNKYPINVMLFIVT